MTTKVITGPNTRFSYLNANDPKSINGSIPKYSASLIIPKEDTVTINKIKSAIEQAYKEGESKLKGNGKSVPALSTLKTPLRDGDLERPDDEAYKNAYFVNANSPHKPGVVDGNRQEIIDTSELYSGIYGRASITFYAFNSNGNKGIACGLNNLQKLRDGEPLGGRTRAEDDFATEDDDDFLNQKERIKLMMYTILTCTIMGLWVLIGLYFGYMTIRDDIRNEIDRRAKQNKEKLSQTPLSRKNK